MRKIWWTSHDIGTFVKGFACLVLVGFLLIPIASNDWLRWILIGLLGLLVLYSIYIYLAIFYIIEEKELSVFCMWKFVHFKYSDIKRVELTSGKFKNLYGRGSEVVKLTCGKYEVYVSPRHPKEFMEALNLARKGIPFKEN